MFPGSRFTGCPTAPYTNAPAGATAGFNAGVGLLLICFEGLLQFESTIAKTKAITAQRIDRLSFRKTEAPNVTTPALRCIISKARSTDACPHRLIRPTPSYSAS